MTQSETRLFRVHGRRLDAPHAQMVTEVSFEAAAVAWLEGWPGEIGSDATVSIIVRDLDSGAEHCFGIDLNTGAAASCDD